MGACASRKGKVLIGVCQRSSAEYFLLVSPAPRTHLREGNLRRATWAGRDRKAEAMQFHDRSDQDRPFFSVYSLARREAES